LKQQNEEQKDLRKRIEGFKKRVAEFRNVFKKNLPFNYTTEMEFLECNSSYDLIQEYQLKL